MNICLRSGFCAVALLALAGCATDGGMASRHSEPALIQKGERVVTDTEYVMVVEDIARRRGVSVHWLNPPMKRIPGGAH
jgi:hypothetical protein